ncbi:MAG: deoxyhypusine synthase family protein, partial [candidate division WOR-3 bacterium]|nr:deoxyhypusine synthase family protein [candidate division WOR-3 bacterium]
MKKFLNEPTRPFQVHNKMTIAELLKQMSKISFQARNLGKAFELYKKMLSVKTLIFFGLAGAMIPAGMRNVISFLIKNRYLDCIVSTGANIFHDIVESLGYRHYIQTHNCDDNELRKQQSDRIYDTLASED